MEQSICATCKYGMYIFFHHDTGPPDPEEVPEAPWQDVEVKVGHFHDLSICFWSPSKRWMGQHAADFPEVLHCTRYEEDPELDESEPD